MLIVDNLDENVETNMEDSKKKTSGKNKGLLVILCILIIALGGVFVTLLLNRDNKTEKAKNTKTDTNKIEKTTFEEETYFVYNDENGYFGYIIFESDGKYNYSYIFEAAYGNAGTYYIEKDKIVLNTEYDTGTGSPYKNTDKKEIDYTNKNTLTFDNKKYNKITKEEFGNWHTDRHGKDIIKYDDVVNMYNKIETEETTEEVRKLNTYCHNDIEEGTVTTNTQTYTVNYEIADYYDGIISSINVIIKNEAGKQVLKGECYNLGTEKLRGYTINSDGTIIALYSDGSDDSINFQAITIDSNGNKKSTKNLTCNNGRPPVEKDKEVVCSNDY